MKSAALFAGLGNLWSIDRSRYDALVEATAKMTRLLLRDSKQRGLFYAHGTAVERRGAIAVLKLHGIIEQRLSWIGAVFGGTSTENFGALFDSVISDKDVKAIAIHVDSPGGTVYGVPELAKKIYDARNAGKPIVAIADPLMASAAYYIASAAHKLYISPSGEAGSIGVMASHVDLSAALEQSGIKVTLIESARFKTEFSDVKPLAEESRAWLQSQVDAWHARFVADVVKHRGITSDRVEHDFGEGRILLAKDAVRVGMMDRIATFDEVMSRLTSGGIRTGPTAEDHWNAPLVAGEPASSRAKKLRVLRRSHEKRLTFASQHAMIK